jgi:hypothetical protein
VCVRERETERERERERAREYVCVCVCRCVCVCVRCVYACVCEVHQSVLCRHDRKHKVEEAVGRILFSLVA